jgi:CBS domain-containing protein
MRLGDGFNNFNSPKIDSKERTMKVKEVMTKKVDVIDSRSTIQAAAEKMKQTDVSDIPVILGKNIVGMITDRDIVTRVVAKGLNPKEVKVVDGMAESLFVCGEDQHIESAAKTMKENHVRRLLVMNSKRKLSGIISIEDLTGKLDAHKAGKILGA